MATMAFEKERKKAVSLAGVRSNRGDGYQTTIALEWALSILAGGAYEWIEVDSTTLDLKGVPVAIDDIVIRRSDGTSTYCQCKKNQKNFDSWSVVDLQDELVKAVAILIADPKGDVAFYSRSNFGELAKLREHAKTQPDNVAYEKSLPAKLAKTNDSLKACWKPLLHTTQLDVFALLQRMTFEVTPEIERMHEQQLQRLGFLVSQGELAFLALWTAIDQLGARISNRGGAVSTTNLHRITRSGLLALLERAGSTVAPPKAQMDLQTDFLRTSAVGRSWKRNIGGRILRRHVLDTLLQAVQAREQSILVTGGPGSGKTCLMLDLLDTLESDKKVATLFIQGREFANCKKHDERVAHGLLRDIVGDVSRMSEHLRTVVLIDSLDVLSLSRDHESLSFFLSILDRLLLRPNVTVVTTCRSFDLKYDNRLAERNWPNIIDIGPLRWENEVSPLLISWGINPKLVDRPTQELLSNPRHLALFADIAQRTGVFNVSTAHTLTRRYLDIIVRGDPNLGEASLQAIELMAHQMLQERRLEVPRARISVSNEVVDRLLSADILRSTQSGNVTFGHQTLLDGLAVSCAERTGGTLLEFIRSLPAVPFVRPTVRSFFSYLGGGDQKAFRSQLRAVFDGEVAFHIKRLVAESLAEVEPTDDNWSLIQHLFRQHTSLFESLYVRANSLAWLAYWQKHLVPIVLAERQAGRLEQHTQRMGTWKNEDPTQVVKFWLATLQYDWVNQEQIAWIITAQLHDFKAWKVPDVLQLLEVLLARPRGKHNRLGPAISRWVEANSLGDDLLWRYIAGGIDAESVHKFQFDGKLQCMPHDFMDKEFLSRRMAKSEQLLEVAIDAIEQWSAVQSVGSRGVRGWNQVFLKETSYGETHSRHDMKNASAEHVLLGAVEAACLNHARENTPWWQRMRDRLCGSPEAAFRYISILACTQSPEANLVVISRIIRDRSMLESSWRYEIGNLISASFWLLDHEVQDVATELILSLFQEDQEVNERRPWILQAQADLLTSIPANLRSPKAQEKLSEVQEMFGPLYRSPHIESWGGFVAPPFSYERFLEIGDPTVIRILGHYREAGRDDWHGVKLVGGADEVGGQLREATSRDPQRFLQLMVNCWDEWPERFRENVLEGAATFLSHRFGNLSFDPEKWKPINDPQGSALSSLILDEVDRHSSYWHHRRAGASAIEACAHVVDSQRDAERVVMGAAEFASAEDPALEGSGSSDLVTTGINSMRGNAAEAVIVLATRWAEGRRVPPDALSSTLLRFACDQHPAVRAVLLRRLAYFQHHEPTLGWKVFEQAVANGEDGIWSLAEPCLYYAYHSSFLTVSKYLSRIESSESESTQETWARISMLACLSGHSDWAAIRAKLISLENAHTWRGATSVLSSNADQAEHRVLCFDGLAAALQHTPEPSGVTQHMYKLFRDSKPVIPVTPNLVRGYFSAIERDANADRFHSHEFDEWLCALADNWPDIALEASEIFAEYALRTKASIYDHGPIARLLTRLFREAEEREEVDKGAMLHRVIALQDNLLACGMYGLQDWLREAERP
jgi:hypothetical protein